MRKEITAKVTKYQTYRCVLECFRKVSTQSQCLWFRSNAATLEKALVPLAVFEPFVAMRS